MNSSRVAAGKAFEYGIAVAFSEYLPATLIDSAQLRTAKEYFEGVSESEQDNIVLSAKEVAAFIAAHDDRLNETDCIIAIQADQRGQEGDVRDIIITNKASNQEIGISAKNRHEAVKHSRLSERIDFGSDWLGIKCSETYFSQVASIFRELKSRQKRGELWRDIADKHQRFYRPILNAFQSELERLFESHPETVPESLIKYLLGRFDFYKVIKENGTIAIQSFNINGTMAWGKRLPLPSRIIEISPKPKSETTILIYFDKGWQISFRIHNASSKVEPSLKFDIQIIGFPKAMTKQEITLKPN